MPKKNGKNTQFIILLLFCLFVFHAVNNYVWLQKDTTPPKWDQSWNLLLSLYHYRTLTGEETRTPQQFSRVYPIFSHVWSSYPPFVHAMAIPFYLALGEYPDVGIFSHVFFMLLLLWAVYQIGSRLYDPMAGLVSAVSVSVFPLVFGLSREYLLDFALVSMVVLSIYLLMRLTEKRTLHAAVLTGIVMGLGMLTKPAFMIFIIGPVSYLVWRERKRTLQKQMLLCLLITAAVAVLVMSLWYIPHWSAVKAFLTRFSGVGHAQLEGDPSWLTWGGITYYGIAVLNGASFLYFVATITAVIILWKKRSHIILPVLWLLVPLVVFTYIANKDVRYLVPALPALALLIGGGIAAIRSPRRRMVCAVSLCILGLIQYGVYTYDVSAPVLKVSTSAGTLNVLTDEYAFARAPKLQNWQILQLLQAIEHHARGQNVSVAIITELPEFNDITWQYFAYLSKLPATLVAGNGAYSSSFNYIITKNGTLGDSWRVHLFRSAAKRFENEKEQFELVYQALLPDSSSALVYHRHKP